MLKGIQYTCNIPYNLSHKYIGFHNIFFQTWREVCITLPTKAKLFWYRLSKRYCSCIGIFNANALPLSGYPKKLFGLYNISFETCGGYCTTIPKPRKKIVLASYCDNILNHETKGHF
jgi:hypothetical protein